VSSLYSPRVTKIFKTLLRTPPPPQDSSPTVPLFFDFLLTSSFLGIIHTQPFSHVPPLVVLVKSTLPRAGFPHRHKASLPGGFLYDFLSPIEIPFRGRSPRSSFLPWTVLIPLVPLPSPSLNRPLLFGLVTQGPSCPVNQAYFSRPGLSEECSLKASAQWFPLPFPAFSFPSIYFFVAFPFAYSTLLNYSSFESC